MNSFKEYLIAQKLRESTVRGHLANLRRFEKWCKKENHNYAAAGYDHLLKFIQHTQQRGVSKGSINLHLNSIRKYYDYLVQTGERKDNPELRVKNQHKKVLQNLLSSEQLEGLYQSFLNRAEWTFKGKKWKGLHERKTVMLGLMIFQGAHTAELKKMETSHISLNKGTVYIPGAGRSNGRVLKLHTLQIIPIQLFFSSKEPSEKLFECKVRNSVFWLMQVLRKSNGQFKNLSQIRSSVIINWLRQYNIRQVQYMAGHKHISSTERYKQEDIQNLQDQVNQFHPLR